MDDLISRQAAIHAFEPLNTIKTDGSIDRKAVIDFLSGIANLDPKTKGSLVMYVMSLPDIQPERKTGKWEIYVISMIDGEGCRCSECGFEGAPYWDFCPNCGADMRKENES